MNPLILVLASLHQSNIRVRRLTGTISRQLQYRRIFPSICLLPSLSGLCSALDIFWFVLLCFILIPMYKHADLEFTRAQNTDVSVGASLATH